MSACVLDLRVPVVDGDSEIMVVNYLRGVVVMVGDRLGLPYDSRLDCGYMAMTQDGKATRYRRYSLTIPNVPTSVAERLVEAWREVAPDIEIYSNGG